MRLRLNLIQGLVGESFLYLFFWLTKLRNFHRDCFYFHFAYLRIMIQGRDGLFAGTFAHQIDRAHINLHKYLFLVLLDYQFECYDFFKSYVILFNYDLLSYFLLLEDYPSANLIENSSKKLARTFYKIL